MLQFQQHLFRAFFFTKWRHVPCALWRHLSSLPHQFSIFDDGNVVCIWMVEQQYGCKHCSNNNKKKLVISTQTLERNFNPRKSKFRPSLASSLSPSPFITVGICICFSSKRLHLICNVLSLSRRHAVLFCSEYSSAYTGQAHGGFLTGYIIIYTNF